VSLLSFVVLLIIAGVCGALGKTLAGSHTGGFVLSIVLGFIGAFVGMWLARRFHLPVFVEVNVGGEAFPVVWSILGAAVVAAVVSAITRPSKK
jgi:uncharacterized membrane protein YeaQ/YmgE (transglycosylase-associated protein family)